HHHGRHLRALDLEYRRQAFGRLRNHLPLHRPSGRAGGAGGGAAVLPDPLGPVEVSGVTTRGASMPVHSISPAALRDALSGGDAEPLRAWCAALEAGGVLYFPETPLPLSAADLEVLLGQQQSGSKLHKNI